MPIVDNISIFPCGCKIVQEGEDTVRISCRKCLLNEIHTTREELDCTKNQLSQMIEKVVFWERHAIACNDELVKEKDKSKFLYNKLHYHETVCANKECQHSLADHDHDGCEVAVGSETVWHRCGCQFFCIPTTFDDRPKF